MRTASALCLVPLLAIAAWAQDLTGTISGVVTDSTGAVVQNAAISITNAGTGVLAWQGKSGHDGAYLAPSLPVGTYNLAFETAGFRRTAITGFDLSVDQRARIDAVLQPGDLKETVTVVGEGLAQLESESSSMGLAIAPSQVEDLPMANRDILNLLVLAGGVSSGGDSTSINANQLSMNGSRTLSSEFTVDGVSVLNGSTGGVGHMPSTEAVREFKVLTSGYSAEYGRSAGGSVNVVIDSGTNRYRGAVYEYFRNEDLNANNYFRNLRGDARPSDRQNQFGAKFSGPVWIPKLYRGRDRTFFFFNYEGVRRVSPSSPISTVFPTAYRTGDFSSTTIPVVDPAANRTPFPGNRIPTSRLDSAALKMVALLPTPNSNGSLDAVNNRRVNNFVNSNATHPGNNDYSARIDENISAGVRLFGRLNVFRSVSPMAEDIPGPLSNATGPSNGAAINATVGLTYTLKPTLIAELRFGFMRNNSHYDPPTLGISVPQVLGIQRAVTDVVPIFSISGWDDLGLNSNTMRRQIDNVFQFAGTVTWVRGRHVVRAGYQLRKNQFNVYNPGGNFAGSYSFNGEMTNVNRTSNNPVNSAADFMLGLVKSGSYDIPQPMSGRRNSNAGAFVQDDWKILPRLTLNLGLRWEYESPVTSSNGIYARVNPYTGKLLVANRNSSGSLDLNPPVLNLAPRAGFAYSLNNKTVVRSAFGIFYSQLFSNLGGIVKFPGFTITQSYGSRGTAVPQLFTLHEGMPVAPVQSFDPFDVERKATTSNPLSASAQFAEVDHLPYSMQWNFGVQRELARGTMLDVSYVGSRGVHLPLSLRFNSVPSFQLGEMVTATGNSVTTQQYRPFPTVNGFQAITDVGSSVYNSLQVRGVRQLSRTFGFLVTYTWSKSIDDGSGIFDYSQPNGLDKGQFPNLARFLDRSVSAFDRTQVFTLTPRYTTRGPKWLRGFSINPIFTIRAGLPDTVSQSNLYPDVITQRPDARAPIGTLYLPKMLSEGTGIRYFRPATDPAFPLAPTGPLFVGSGSTRRMLLPASIGNLGRYMVRIPGDVNLNLSVNRRFRIGERVALQLRGDAFNAFNHTNFGGPGTSLSVTSDPRTLQPIFSSPGFGLITSARAARFMQLVARLEF